jgi:hypothetical protein
LPFEHFVSLAKENQFAIDLGNGNEVTDQRPLTVSGVKLKSLTPHQKASLSTLTETFGVQVRVETLSLEFFKTVNNREISLFNVEASDRGLETAETNLQMASSDLQQMLAAKFHTSFVTAGGTIGFNKDGIQQACAAASNASDGATPAPEFLRLKHSGAFNPTTVLRQAGLMELDAAGEALSVSDPAHLEITDGPLRIFFISQSHESTTPVALVTAPENTRALLVCQNAMRLGNYSVHDVAKFFVGVLAQISADRYRAASKRFANIQELASLANSLTIFRQGHAERKAFLKSNRTLYLQTKLIDQQEIDTAYGLHPNGLSLKVRLPGGRLAINSDATRNEVHHFEENA